MKPFKAGRDATFQLMIFIASRTGARGEDRGGDGCLEELVEGLYEGHWQNEAFMCAMREVDSGRKSM